RPTAILIADTSSLRERCLLVKQAQGLVAVQVWHLKQRAVDASLAIGRECGLVGRRVEHRDRQSPGIASGREGSLAQAGDRTLGLPVAARAREPAIAELDHALQGMVGLAAEKDWRMRLLLRLGVEPDGIEVHELAVKFGFLLGPQRLHGQHAFAQQLEAGVVARAVILHLLGVPTPANSEHEAPTRELVETGNRFGSDDRVALWHQGDTGTELQRTRRRRCERQGYER